MKYIIKLIVIIIVSLQSINMQASHHDMTPEQERQAVINDAMNNYTGLQDGFNFLQNQNYPVPSFYDFLEQNIFQFSHDDHDDFDMHELIQRAENVLNEHMKDSFVVTLAYAIEENYSLDHFQDPLFLYVMQHKDDYMQNMVRYWLYEWGVTKNLENQTPLHRAVLCDNAEIARFLIDAGVNINSKSLSEN